MQARRALVLGAHPDDEVGCAGFIQRLITLSFEVRIVTFSRCQDLNGPELIDEWEDSTDRLGIQSRALHDLPNRTMEGQAVLDILDDEEAPELVLTPATWDSHQDHYTVTSEAIRRFKRTSILGYELPLNNVLESRLSYYVPLSQAEIQTKGDIAAIYASQRGKRYMDRVTIRALAMVRGMQIDLPLAEAFETIRIVWR